MTRTPIPDKQAAQTPAPLAPVGAKPGQPLYASVKQALVAAIDGGHFPPDKPLPSTKDLSRQMSVSLVTAHRALRELVGEGVLDRARGRGTMIVDRSNRAARKLRLSVMIHREVSLVDEHHSRLLEGMRQASANHPPGGEVELTVSHYGARVAPDCDGILLLDPPEDDLADCLARLPTSAARLIVGHAAADPAVPSIAVDSRLLAKMAVGHLIDQGHRAIAFLGSSRSTGGNRELWEQFAGVCAELGVPFEHHATLRVNGWRVDPQEKLRLLQLLDGRHRPTAVVAAGYYFSLDVYDAASTLGLRVPQDLSVVGVGNPASAGHLAPPLTCIQEPLVELGHASINAIVDAVHPRTPDSTDDADRHPVRTLRPEIVVRQSVARR